MIKTEEKNYLNEVAKNNKNEKYKPKKLGTEVADVFDLNKYFKYKKALADAGMKVGKVNSALEKHFQKVGATMADEWKAKAGSRGASVLAAYK